MEIGPFVLSFLHLLHGSSKICLEKNMRGTSAILKVISQSATSISSTPEGWLDIMVIVFHHDIQQRTNHDYGHLGTCDQQHRAH